VYIERDVLQQLLTLNGFQVNVIISLKFYYGTQNRTERAEKRKLLRLYYCRCFNNNREFSLISLYFNTLLSVHQFLNINMRLFLLVFDGVRVWQPIFFATKRYAN
jgi:hypothetical protein